MGWGWAWQYSDMTGYTSVGAGLERRSGAASMPAGRTLPIYAAADADLIRFIKYMSLKLMKQDVGEKVA